MGNGSLFSQPAVSTNREKQVVHTVQGYLLSVLLMTSKVSSPQKDCLGVCCSSVYDRQQENNETSITRTRLAKMTAPRSMLGRPELVALEEPSQLHPYWPEKWGLGLGCSLSLSPVLCLRIPRDKQGTLFTPRAA